MQAGAVSDFTAVLADRLRVLGPNDPDTLTAGATWRGGEALLGMLWVPRRGPRQFSGPLRVLGPDHPDTLLSRNDLASWRGDAGDPFGAVTGLTELVADYERLLGPDHPRTLIS
jgi:hypothetical protein